MALLHWSAIAGIGDPGGRCDVPRRVVITPFDQTTHVTVAWQGGGVCERGRIDVGRLAFAG